MRHLVVLLLALSLGGCLKPAAEVCNKPGACVFNFNTCTIQDACTAKPLELKAP